MIFSYETISVLASLKTVFVDKPENILILLRIAEQVPTLKRIVLTKKLDTDKDNEIREKAKNVGIEIMSYNQMRVSSTQNEFEFDVMRQCFVFKKELGRSKPVNHHVN